MTDLIGMLLEFVLELFIPGPEGWGGWRFGLPLVGALAVVALIEWLVPEGGAQVALMVPVVLAGLGTGILWEIAGSRDRLRVPAARPRQNRRSRIRG